ncbi:hypothetical protein, partial [Pseudomonas avellanae]|uniref:hypothetical protein n=1 Tax=Pseudomonas avellanae TaxID=46257 RepID=UPI001ED9A46F
FFVMHYGVSSPIPEKPVGFCVESVFWRPVFARIRFPSIALSRAFLDAGKFFTCHPAEVDWCTSR